MSEFLFKFIIGFIFALVWYFYAESEKPSHQPFDEWKVQYLVATLISIFICWVAQFIPFMEWLYRASPPFSGFFMSLLIIHSLNWLYRDYVDTKDHSLG